MEDIRPSVVAERHALLARVSSNAFFDLMPGVLPSVSDEALALLGSYRCSPAWKPMAAWRRLRRKDRQALRDAIATLASDAPGEARLTLELEVDDTSCIALNALAIIDADGNVQRIVGTVEDVTHERRSVQAHRRDAETDYLTGLANRRAAQEQIERFVAAADIHAFALAFIDLNKFKDVNDRHGHAAGDQMLKTVAHRLRSASGRHDVVARLGGDEFMVLFRSPGEGALLRTLERAREIVEQPMTLDNGEVLKPSVSIGATWVDGDDSSDTEVLREADMAMYISKEQSIGETVLYEHSMLEVRRQQKKLVEQLREGMQSDAFELWYQPIVNTRNPAYVGFEALMRWRDSHGRVVPADEFISVLEHNRLITQLTELMLTCLADDLEQWNRAGCLPDSVAFNLSPLQLSSDGLLDNCRAFMARVDVLPVQIIVEVTETAVIENMVEARRILDCLREHGARIALDDFGVGYSSLAVLHRLPVEILKLDGEFTHGMFQSDRALKIVRAVLELAATLSMPAVAERVETAAQADWLTQAGCTYLQGFLFSEPLSKADAFDHMALCADRTQLRRAS